MIGASIKAWLAHPLTRELDLDDPRTTQLRRQIIQEKRLSASNLSRMVYGHCAGTAGRRQTRCSR